MNTNTTQANANTSYPREYLTPAEAAANLALSKRTLENFRTRGGGPVFRRFGGAVRYHRDDLAAWANAGKRRSTSEH